MKTSFAGVWTRVTVLLSKHANTHVIAANNIHVLEKKVMMLELQIIKTKKVEEYDGDNNDN